MNGHYIFQLKLIFTDAVETSSFVSSILCVAVKSVTERVQDVLSAGGSEVEEFPS